ncbi:hypothetical protein KIF59_18060 [Enterobacter cloacae subsp. cloacae]|nr:hypothetical protein [Enterobacter cloacae subsp. cloacae]
MKKNYGKETNRILSSELRRHVGTAAGITALPPATGHSTNTCNSRLGEGLAE